MESWVKKNLDKPNPFYKLSDLFIMNDTKEHEPPKDVKMPVNMKRYTNFPKPK